MKEEHVPEGPVGEGRTEHRDLVLGRPVVDGALVLDLKPETGDDFWRSPNRALRWKDEKIFLTLTAMHSNREKTNPTLRLVSLDESYLSIFLI